MEYSEWYTVGSVAVLIGGEMKKKQKKEGDATRVHQHEGVVLTVTVTNRQVGMRIP